MCEGEIQFDSLASILSVMMRGWRKGFKGKEPEQRNMHSQEKTLGQKKLILETDWSPDCFCLNFFLGLVSVNSAVSSVFLYD